MPVIRSIAIIGRDQDAWVAALMLQRAFRRMDSPVLIDLVELPSRLSEYDAITALPSLGVLLETLGLDEGAVMQRASGAYSMAQRFSNWSKNKTDFFLAYDSFGVPIEGIDFTHFWQKAHSKGLRVPLEDFNLGIVAAKSGKLVDGSTRRAFSEAKSGYHLHAKTFVRAIGEAVVKAGVTCRTGEIREVVINDNNIQAIYLANDEKICADLYIDASGELAELMSKMDGSAFESWSDRLPFDGMICGVAPPIHPTPSFAQITAFEEGWIGLYPLAKKLAVKIAYDSNSLTQQEAIKNGFAHSGIQLENAIDKVSHKGIRSTAWVGNCVAVGNAYCKLDDIDALDMSLLHLGISHLLELLPVNETYEEELAIYNQQMHAYAQRQLDFQSAHYALNQREGNKVWDRVKAQKPSQELAHKIALFKDHGTIAMYEHEIFYEENWLALFWGFGLVPRQYDPRVDRIAEQDLMVLFQKILKSIRSEVDTLPSLQSHLEIYNA